MKRYAQDWINSSKCDEDKACFTTEHPRFAELIEGKLIRMYVQYVEMGDIVWLKILAWNYIWRLAK